MKLTAAKALISGGMFAILFILSCARNNHSVSRVSVKPPFEKLQTGDATYEIDAATGGTLKMNNGTRIVVPAGAFTDVKSNIIKKKVQLQYREFHNAADILASGIPMNYDSAGVKMNFESAGMFEINASCDNVPVKLAAGKQIQVNMASFKEGNQFNFYRYNKQSNNWECQGTAKPLANTDKQNELKAFEAIHPEPKIPQPINNNKYAMDLDLDYAMYPELKPFEGILWQYAGTDPSKDPKNFMKTLSGSAWTNLQLTPVKDNAMIYNLELDCGNKHFSTVVQPVLKGKDLARARKKFREELDNYKMMEANMQQERKRIENEASLVRSFQVSNFGIYNWDCAMKDPAVVLAPADFNFDQHVDKSKITVYLVSGDARKLVTYYPGCWNEFSFNPHTRNCLVAVMPNDRLAIFDSEQFSLIHDWKPGKPIQFNLKTQKEPVKDLAQLNEILNSI
jgi:hypothetical protein